MPRRLNDLIDVREAIGVSAAGAPAAIVGTKVNGAGYSRARFIFQMAKSATTGSLSTGLGVWQASTSGAAYALAASAVAVTSGGISGNANPVVVIDIPINSASPWLQMSGSFTQTGVSHSAVVELYNGVNRPPVSTAQQIVVI